MVLLAFLYSNGVMQDLGTLLGGYQSYARGINNKGQVAGYSTTNGNSLVNAFLDSGGVIQDLGTLPGGTWREAHGINNNAQVVGVGDAAATVRTVLSCTAMVACKT